MSSTKEYLMAIEEERFEAWMAEHHPGVEPDTCEWEAFANEYSWEQEYLQEAAEDDYQQAKFELSLNSVTDQYKKATDELESIQALLSFQQPDLVYRLAFAHTVTVMEAYLIYCARALLNHRLPLRRFEQAFESWSFHVPKGSLRKAIENGEFKTVAQLTISKMTFHRVDRIKEYFGSVLHILPPWNTDPLKVIVQTRQDLVHRNGVTEQVTPVMISAHQVGHAVATVRAFIDAVDTSMRLELAYFADLDTH